MDVTDYKDLMEAIKNGAEALGVLIGGGYFLFRATRGELLATAALAITLERGAGPSGNDHLKATVRIRKGRKGSINLEALHVRASQVAEGETAKSLPVGRLPVSTDSSDHKSVVDWTGSDASLRKLNLNDGDECEFATSFVVPRDAVITIEAVLVGSDVDLSRSSRPDPGQWRASAVSLPRAASDLSQGHRAAERAA